MNGEYGQNATKVWECDHCGTSNVTSERDLFSDQCRDCTEYNDVDWTEQSELTVSQASAAADRMEAE